MAQWTIEGGRAIWPFGDEKFNQWRHMAETGMDYFCTFVDQMTQELHQEGHSPDAAAGLAYLIGAFPYFNKRVITIEESQPLVDEIYTIMSAWELRTRGKKLPDGTWRHHDTPVKSAF